MSFRCDKCKTAIVTVPGRMMRGDSEVNVVIGAKPIKVVTKIRSDKSIVREESWCNSCVIKNPDFRPEVIRIIKQEVSQREYTKITRES